MMNKFTKRAVLAVTALSVAVLPVALSMHTDGVVWLHVPPGLASVRVVLVPTHNTADPLIAAGSGLTVMALVIWQVVGSV